MIVCVKRGGRKTNRVKEKRRRSQRSIRKEEERCTQVKSEDR